MRRMQFDDWAAKVAVGLGALAVFGVSSAVAQAPPANWEEMADRLGELEKRNDALQERVNELESEEGEHWLTEARASEIRGVVADVLSDADTRVSLQSSGVTAGWDDGFFLQSPDGRFRLNIGGMAQVRYQYSSLRETYPETFDDSFIFGDQQGSRSGYDVPHARMDLNGNVFGPGTGFRLLGEYASQRGEIFQPWGEGANYYGTHHGNVAGSFRLLDAWMSHEITPGFSIRAGQFKLPFDRGWDMPIKYQMTGERTSVAHHMGLGRSQGAELRWSSDTVRIRGALSDGANDNLLYGYYIDGTQPMNSPWWYQQSDWSVSGRLEWKMAGSWADFNRMTSLPGDDFSVMMGFGLHAQRNKLNVGQKNPTQGDNKFNEWLATTADLSMNFGGASLTASGYFHSVKAGTTLPVQPFAAPGSGTNPTYDLGTVQLVGASLFGSVYVTSDVEMFTGWEYMAIIGNPMSGLTSVAEGYMRIYDDPQAFNALTMGFNWFIDGEDLKFTFAFTYMPSEVSYGWTTLDTGIRGTPVSDGFALRTQLQLLF